MAKREKTYRNLIPEPVTRILAFHGAVQVASGLGRRRVSASVHLAPFDDILALFLPAGSPFSKAIERDPKVELFIQGGEQNYSVRIKGRAVCSGPAGGHGRRMEIVPWLPDGSTLQRFHLVELLPERIEFSYDDGGERRHFEGNTDAAKVPTLPTRWLDACFGGIVHAVVLAFVVLWAWVGWYGQWYTLRVAALALSLAGALGMLAAARLAYRSLAFRAWQRRKAARFHAGPVGEGLLPLASIQVTSGVLALLSLVCVIASGAMWGGGLAGIALLASQLWYLVPWWMFRFAGDMDSKTRPA